ncbi:hypothetical protein BH695_5239 [Microcystis aeruginosa PCC 7806SL]|uniref:Uncharacterized protein n=1 Tax=Microcystis aeruginosa PCC 7806SL TaxID=1903187 RepID=A0AB33CCH3_MICA7|nr:hypothetical protein BH695_5239 [Microcystis aeruginosa PCC 7806SL]
MKLPHFPTSPLPHFPTPHCARRLWLFVTCYGSIGGHKSTKSLSGKGFN